MRFKDLGQVDLCPEILSLLLFYVLVSMANESPVNVVIVGAGLGGLSAAIAIARSGHRVKVIEQAPKLGEVGISTKLPYNEC